MKGEYSFSQELETVWTVRTVYLPHNTIGQYFAKPSIKQYFIKRSAHAGARCNVLRRSCANTYVRPYSCKWNIRNSISPGILPPSPDSLPRISSVDSILPSWQPSMPSYASRFTSCASIESDNYNDAVATCGFNDDCHARVRISRVVSIHGQRRPWLRAIASMIVVLRASVREVAPTLVWIGQSIRIRQCA